MESNLLYRRRRVRSPLVEDDACDGLRKGAALNGIQIAERLFGTY